MRKELLSRAATLHHDMKEFVNEKQAQEEENRKMNDPSLVIFAAPFVVELRNLESSIATFKSMTGATAIAAKAAERARQEMEKQLQELRAQAHREKEHALQQAEAARLETERVKTSAEEAAEEARREAERVKAEAEEREVLLKLHCERELQEAGERRERLVQQQLAEAAAKVEAAKAEAAAATAAAEAKAASETKAAAAQAKVAAEAEAAAKAKAAMAEAQTQTLAAALAKANSVAAASGSSSSGSRSSSQETHAHEGRRKRPLADVEQSAAGSIKGNGSVFSQIVTDFGAEEEEDEEQKLWRRRAHQIRDFSMRVEERLIALYNPAPRARRTFGELLGQLRHHIQHPELYRALNDHLREWRNIASHGSEKPGERCELPSDKEMNPYMRLISTELSLNRQLSGSDSTAGRGLMSQRSRQGAGKEAHSRT